MTTGPRRAARAGVVSLALALSSPLSYSVPVMDWVGPGLQEMERIARPDDFAGLTSVCYSVSYLGFGITVLLAFLHQSRGLGYPMMFAVAGPGAMGCLALVARNDRA
ncbi:hypothetical protein ACW2Q0_16435 [Nocardia sp. R16R-3T]